MISTTPLHLQRREAAERVRIARTMAAAFPDDENRAELAEALEAFHRLTGREGFEQRDDRHGSVACRHCGGTGIEP